ncbi:MAG: hypothetical protein NVV63_05575 [Opitutus sp.]|nr:hypothetical protein [Opitutus sp.]
MKRILLLSLSLLVVSSSTGCFFWKKKKKPKENSAVATEVEGTFKQRWLDRRIAELATQDIAPDAARRQAEAEFERQFPYLRSNTPRK